MLSKWWTLVVFIISQQSPLLLSGVPRSWTSCLRASVDDRCENGGICRVYSSSTRRRGLPAIATCHCQPAWTGGACQIERDPCTDGTGVCGGGWQCVRNVSNVGAGFDCGCHRRTGYGRISELRPQCVDVDECALLVPACHHRGTCHNRAGTFSCQCRDGFRGPRCGERLRPSRAPDGWRAWSRWSPCCEGHQTRVRTCRRRAGCEGDPEQSRTCAQYAPRPTNGTSDAATADGHTLLTAAQAAESSIIASEAVTNPDPATVEGVILGSETVTGAEPLEDVKGGGWVRQARRVANMARYWKLLHYLGFEPAQRRRRRSLAQIQSYDDLETRLQDMAISGSDAELDRQERQLDPLTLLKIAR